MWFCFVSCLLLLLLLLLLLFLEIDTYDVWYRHNSTNDSLYRCMNTNNESLALLYNYNMKTSSAPPQDKKKTKYYKLASNLNLCGL